MKKAYLGEKSKCKGLGAEHFKKVSGMARGPMWLQQRMVGGFMRGEGRRKSQISQDIMSC